MMEQTFVLLNQLYLQSDNYKHFFYDEESFSFTYQI
ncbi:hypothetical protein pb186bvf_004208 [Paramecium bursaria]